MWRGATVLLLAAAPTVAGFGAPPADRVDALRSRLLAVANHEAAKYECAVAIGVHSAHMQLRAVSTGTPVGAPFVWGSVTKLLTGSAVLRAVEAGKLVLNKPVHPILDPALRRLGLGSMAELFGPLARRVTAHHLGSMTSGVPDYDTAVPWPPPPLDPFRATVYDHPTAKYPPAALLNLSWVATGKLLWFPGTKQEYSSTNFVLLGLLLAELENAPSWDAYDQSTVFDAMPKGRRAPPTRRPAASAAAAAAPPPRRADALHRGRRARCTGMRTSSLRSPARPPTGRASPATTARRTTARIHPHALASMCATWKKCPPPPGPARERSLAQCAASCMRR